ncbi:methyl-CpG-binding domain protein 2 isoform X2 [Drosophila rhopaloa]|uniref:Methyl-CpG-binding domain protein 2 isoform X2 n=1 Tax=Drosophila rhopaloa TaxID=1041015 RepID=A0A6P4EL25_DRORH|nr:methyl-CpG-binding domain protein 2 isoform X2 [Drosophila rhopaloa]
MQMNPSVTIERKRVDCSVLPKGWQRDEVRKSGNSSNSNANSNNNSSTTASSNNNNNKVDVFYYSRALRTDVSLVPPIRQTASIFKQPVTAIRNHSQDPAKVKHDAKHGTQEKPKQLFWEKRLERLRACQDNGEELDDISLPKTIRTVGPNVNEQTVLQSVATALHMLNAGVHGQSSTKSDLTKNAMAFMDPEQPLMHAVIISEDDIRKQEDRVGVARRKLQDALKT